MLFMVVQWKAEKYAPAGRCIYCGADADLTDEHIIPFALLPNLISQTGGCIGAENLRKLLCSNKFPQLQERPDADRVYADAVRI